MKKGNGDLLILLTGLILMAVGLYLLRCYEAAEGVLRVLPFLLIGLGCGLFGQGAGNMVGKRALKNSSEIARQLEIEQKDERNVKISHWSKAKAFSFAGSILPLSSSTFSSARTLTILPSTRRP